MLKSLKYHRFLALAIIRTLLSLSLRSENCETKLAIGENVLSSSSSSFILTYIFAAIVAIVLSVGFVTEFLQTLV